MKKVSFAARPPAAAGTASADAWVADRPAVAEPLKRLTIDVPLGLHRRVKAGCVREEVYIADVVRDFLDRRFPTGDTAPGHDGTGPRAGDGS